MVIDSPPPHTTFLVPQLAVTIEAQTLTYTERLRGARVTKCGITCGCGSQITWKWLLEYEAESQWQRCSCHSLMPLLLLLLLLLRRGLEGATIPVYD